MGNSPIRIGISACLLGEEVRFDGGHKRDHFLTTVLAPHVEFVPVCPEVEMGLGTPREPVRLVRAADGPRMITVHSGIDHTASMHQWASDRLDALAREDLCGYIFKSNSPSCGVERVKIYGEGDGSTRDGRGLFAAALIERLPLLPVEDEERLSTPIGLEQFLERVFAYRFVKMLMRPSHV